jgi:hypothetical protein
LLSLILRPKISVLITVFSIFMKEGNMRKKSCLFL